jgi:hypothetical protein
MNIPTATEPMPLGLEPRSGTSSGTHTPLLSEKNTLLQTPHRLPISNASYDTNAVSLDKEELKDKLVSTPSDVSFPDQLLTQSPPSSLSPTASNVSSIENSVRPLPARPWEEHEYANCRQSPTSNLSSNQTVNGQTVASSRTMPRVDSGIWIEPTAPAPLSMPPTASNPPVSNVSVRLPSPLFKKKSR